MRQPSFNPRPLLLTGESPDSATAHLALNEFQSTPVIANGRIAAGGGGGAARGGVSIHARYC